MAELRSRTADRGYGSSLFGYTSIMFASMVLTAGAAAGRGGSPLWVFYIVVAFVVVGFVLSLVRLRRGGPGPAVNYVPPGLRPRLNSLYRRMGWQAPYDERGDRRPDRSGL
jgi:hypothetical protein